MDEVQWNRIMDTLRSEGFSLEELDEVNHKLEEITARWLFPADR